MFVNTGKIEDDIREVVVSLIYHGRHFSPKRDAVVIEKSTRYILDVIVEYMDSYYKKESQ